MSEILLLSQDTIDKIAAGEVVERPFSVVKELTENSVDAGARAVTVEIKDGGISLIRVTDDGCGIPAEEVRSAFLRHATSKIRSIDDLTSMETLGFRGEALSSIAAVAQMEMITKTKESLLGVRYVIEGGREMSLEEIGAPDGTTIIARNLFYHTPARKKFLKSAATEGSSVGDLMERMALSHPGIAFRFISNNDTKMQTSGSGNLLDNIYGIYGREIASNLEKIDAVISPLSITGYIGKPIISRGNRNYENYFVNGRYVKNDVISRAVEEAYKPFLMSHRYPFTVLMIQINPKLLDVNVHPSKMELRFADQGAVYESVYQTLKEALNGKEQIPEFTIQDHREKKATTAPEKKEEHPEPFEKVRAKLSQDSPYEPKYPDRRSFDVSDDSLMESGNYTLKEEKPVQEELFQEDQLLSSQNRKRHKIIGQVFDTYWIVEFDDKMYIIDQHAAHEKVLYERFINQMANKQQTSQMITPPLIVSLSMPEEEMLAKNMDQFQEAGFEIEPFGGREYAIRAVPGDIPGIADEALFHEILDALTDIPARASAEAVREKIASMSCKAAVKGNHPMSVMEADALIDELLSLDNPYNCPHGRPTIITMSKTELEKKFKRIV